MKKLIVIIALILPQTHGCRENGEIPSRVVTIGSGRFDGITGFNFERNASRFYSPSEEGQIDFSVFDKLNSNMVVEPFLINLDSLPVFSLTESFGSKELAEQFFDKYSLIQPSTYELFAFDLKVYQIWTIKTTVGKFAKLMILEIKNGDLNTPYAELTFRWDFVD